MEDDEKLLKNNFVIFEGVKIIPGKLILRNAYEGKSFKEKITFQNTATRPVEVTTVIPKSYYFEFNKTLRRVKISCGWCDTLWVKHTYTYVAPAEFHIQVYVNDLKFDYLIEVDVSKGEISCEPRTVKFDTINLGHAVHVQKLRLYNKGYTQSKFQFDVPPNNLGLAMFPRKGFLLGRSTLDVDIELIGFEEGEYNKEIWIKCEPPIRFNIVVEVIKPQIQIWSPKLHTEFFLPITFPACYGGSTVKREFEIFNYNVLDTTYIIVPEFQRKITAMHKAKHLDPNYKYFNFNPIIGKMTPNEKKRIEVTFESRKTSVDSSHFVWYRVIRLECEDVQVPEQNLPKPRTASERRLEQESDFISVPSVNSFLESTADDKITHIEEKIVMRSFDDYLRLCLYGVSKTPKVEAEPVQFVLSEMTINTEKKESLILRNHCTSLPIYFEYEKVLFINVTPSRGKIDILESIQLNVVFCPKTTVSVQNRIRINLYYYSQDFDTNKTTLSNVGYVDIPVYIPVKILTTIPQPKFNMGITPMITNEVGFMTNDVRFNTKIGKPKMAMQLCYQTESWKKYDNALIAFPNDRPACLQPWRNKDVACVTIFANIPRCIAPIDEYMLTYKEVIKKYQNDKKYKDYITKMREGRIKPAPVWEDYCTNESKLLGPKVILNCPSHYLKPEDSEITFRKLEPIEIYFVSVNPAIIAIGSVLVDSITPYWIEICNENTVPVHILITSFHRHIDVLPDLPDEFIVKPNEKIVVIKNIHVMFTGSFNTVLNVYLNRCHLIPVVLQAEVITPVVTLDNNQLIFDDKQPDHTKIIPLRNTFNCPIQYYWDIPESSCYSIWPEEGTIPPGRYIYNELTYVPDDTRRNSERMLVICEHGASQAVNVNACYTTCCVDILESSIKMPHVPLNILVERTNVLRNQSNQTVLFKIRNSNPCYGVTIEPECGVIYAKSDTVLTIKLLFGTFVKFDCYVIIDFEYGLKKRFNLSGAVDIPNIVYTPKHLHYKRVPAGSYEIMPFQIFNKGKTPVHLNFPHNIYPELSVLGKNRIDEHATESIDLTLDHNESVRLFINFTPFELLMDTIYLPVVINGIIGPANKTEPDSKYLHAYIDKNVSLISNDEATVEQIPVKKKLELPILKLSLLSCKQILRFSKTVLHFKYHQTVPSRSCTEQEIKIASHATYPVEFGAHIATMSPYFQMHCPPEKTIFCDDDTVKAFKIEPKEELVLTIKFIPKDYGDHGCSVPFYIKDVKDGFPFNYLLLRSHYPPPSFTTLKYVFIDPIPVNCLITKDIPITLNHHYIECEMTADCDYENLKLQVIPVTPPRKSLSGLELTKEAVIKVAFSSNTPVFDLKRIKITCTCGAEATIIVTLITADDILTTYTFRIPGVPNDLVNTSRGFPLFPHDSDTSDYAIYMRKCVTFLERWVHDQVLNSTYYYFIPEDMSGFFRTKKKSKTHVLVISQILYNLAGIGNGIIPYKELSEDEVQRAYQMHCNFKFILQYLRNRGMFLPHCRMRYLLPYKDYVIHMTKVRKLLGKFTQGTRPKDYFYRRSKQCWVDLLLNMYKILVLSRVNLRRRMSRHSSITNLQSNAMYTPEQSLLIWLDKIYEQQRENLILLDKSRPEHFQLPIKTICNFAADFSNSLVMIAVTIHYCPYVIPFLKDIFVITQNHPERCFHNAVALLEVWKLLNCSFKITPSDIVNPIPLQMVFLTMFMYDFFQTLYPKEEILYYTGLSLKDTKEIILKNPNNTEAHYQIKFLDNNLDCFRALTSSDIIKISPNKTFKLDIEFWAKTMAPQTCTLLFCGDNPGYTYTKSLAYSLRGESHFFDEHITNIFEVDLYKSREVSFTIQSPYKEAATYSAVCSRGTPQEVKMAQLKPVSLYLKNIQPRTIYSKHHEFITNDEGEGMMQITLCCLSTVVFKATIIFTNPKIGDFLFCAHVVPVNFNRIEKYLITAHLPTDWDERACNCCQMNRLANPKRCPKRIVVEIPSKNDQFWYIIMKAVMQGVPEEDKDVWEEILDTEMGALLLRWMLSGTEEQKTIDHLFSENLIYKVNNPHKSIVMPESVMIPNIRGDEMVKLEMHVQSDNNKYLDFSLESEDGSEFRWYTIEFEKMSPSVEALKSDSSLKGTPKSGSSMKPCIPNRFSLR